MMKSYTLNNWDGSLGGSEDKTQSLTSAHSVASNLQTSTSSYTANFGNAVGSTVYRGEHGKEGIGTDNNSHDASMEGVDNWVNGDLHNADDVSSSSKEPAEMRQDGTRSAPWIAEFERAFKNASSGSGNAVVAETHAYSESSILPLNTAGTSGAESEALKASNAIQPDTEDKMNPSIAPGSAANLFDSELLSFTTTIEFSPKWIPNGPDAMATMQKSLMFIPDLSSPLHVVKPYDAPRRSPIASSLPQTNMFDVPMDSPMSSIYLQSSLPSPESEHPDSDVISVHTADGEGTDEDDEVIILEQIPSNYSSSKPRSDADMNDSLFTPPPSEQYTPPQIDIALENIFTPSPPPAKRKPTRPPRRLPKPYILLPPLQRPRSDYIPISKLPKKKPRPKPQVQVHNDLARAMQASWDNNDSIGALPLKKKNANVNRPKGKEIKVQREKPPVAGPSRLSSISVSSRGGQPQKRRRNDMEDRDERSILKRPRITIDLTLSDGNDKKKRKRDEKAKPAPQSALPSPNLPSPRSQYDAGKDHLRLFLGVLRETPPDLVLHNTRFIRRSVRGTLPLDSLQSLEADMRSISGKTRKKVDVSWPLLRSRSSTASTMDSEDEISLGGRLVWAEDYSDEDEDDDVVIVNKAPRPETVAGSLVPPAQPRRIDLAAQFKKRKQKSQVATNVRRPSTAISVTSPSVSSIRPVNHQTRAVSPSVASSNKIADVPPTPSAKALGKRKAVSLTPIATPLHHPPPLNHFNPPLSNQPESPTNNMNRFIHNYQLSPVQPSFSSSSSTTYIQQMSLLPSQFFNGLVSSAHSQAYPSQPVSSTSRNDNIFSDSFGDQHIGQPDSWAISQEYDYSTIDPTLLGGHSLEPAFQEPDLALDVGPHLEFQEELFQIRPSPTPSLIPSPPVPLSPAHFNARDPNTFQSIPNLKKPEHTDASSSAGASVFELPPRSRGRSSTSEYVSSSSSSDSSDADSESDVVVVNNQRPPLRASTTLENQAAQFSAPLFTTLSRADKLHWPPASTAEYCHQCRRKTFIPKMTCRCSKMFCYRCIKLRYPDRNFNTKVKQKTCPHCENYCNCTICCQRRGVIYVSSTRMQDAKLNTNSRPVLQRINRSANTKTPSPPSPPRHIPYSTAPPKNAQYWGTIYSLDGQKIGTTFAAPAADGLPPVVFSGTPGQSPRPPKRLKLAFIGRIQTCWGFGRNRLLKEVNPVHTKKSHKSGSRNIRTFIGSTSFLRYRMRPCLPDPPDDDLLGGLSPLTLLSDSDDPDELEGIKDESTPEEAFTPGCLEERDVARAIAASFLSLGIRPVFELPYLY